VGLAQLQIELEWKYIVNISSISYALAVDLNFLDGSPLRRKTELLVVSWPTVLFVVSWPTVLLVVSWPTVWSPANFVVLAIFHLSSGFPSCIWQFLLFPATSIPQQSPPDRDGDNMNGADPLSYGYFQAYSNIKRSIRHGPQFIGHQRHCHCGLDTTGVGSASIQSRPGEMTTHASTAVGSTTPEDSDASKPFAREQRRVDAAVQERNSLAGI
jgi:hypothetical protein